MISYYQDTVKERFLQPLLDLPEVRELQGRFKDVRIYWRTAVCVLPMEPIGYLGLCAGGKVGRAPIVPDTVEEAHTLHYTDDAAVISLLAVLLRRSLGAAIGDLLRKHEYFED